MTENEAKAVSTLLQAHVAQGLNYLAALKKEHGMLINFGSEKFQCRKLARSRSGTQQATMSAQSPR